VLTGRHLRVLLGAALAVLLVATVAGAWVRAVRPGDRLVDASPYLERVDWEATLAADGTLAVQSRYRLKPAAVALLGSGIAVTLPLPRDAVRVQVDGQPAAVSGPGRTGTLPRARSITIGYQVPATRQVGGQVLLDALVAPSLAQLTPTSYGYVEVRGVLRVDAGVPVEDAEWRFPGARLVRGDEHDTVLAFAGAVSTYDAAGLVALLPADAAPDAPPHRDRDRDAEQALADAAGARAEGRIPDGEPVPQGPVALLVALLVTLELVGLGLWSAYRLRRAHRMRTTEPGPPSDAIADPPDDVEPDVVAMLAATSSGTVATREAVAADVLHLVDRGTVRLSSLDSRRFQIRIPAGAIGRTVAEQAVLTALRPQGQAGVATELLGPPLWGAGPHAWLDRLERDVRNRARRAGFLARALPPRVFVPAALLVPLTALIGSGEDSRVVVTSVLALLAALAFSAVVAVTSPLMLTSRGADVRRRARAFARSVDQTGAMGDLGAPAVLTRGPHLVYAVAAGACPVAARDVGTGRLLAVPAEPALR
jgi:hypothetical protein